MIRTKFFKLTTNTRTVQETVRRITNEILGVKGLKHNLMSKVIEHFLCSSLLISKLLENNHQI